MTDPVFTPSFITLFSASVQRHFHDAAAIRFFHTLSVHLKDSTGEYHKDIFPTLGTGVVDFPGVFQLLGERSFNGPYTLELEGPEKRTREEQFRHVAESIEHLRSIGAFD